MVGAGWLAFGAAASAVGVPVPTVPVVTVPVVTVPPIPGATVPPVPGATLPTVPLPATSGPPSGAALDRAGGLGAVPGAPTSGGGGTTIAPRAAPGAVAGPRAATSASRPSRSAAAAVTENPGDHPYRRAAASAARQLSVPVALTLLVGAFLVMSPASRRDHKLTEAPLTAADELVRFW